MIRTSVLAALALAFPAAAQDFVHWENPHVHPLDMTPDGSLLLAVNTPDARLEVFDLSGGSPAPSYACSVGVDPVSVRARSDGEAWVVNHVSDSVSVVDLASGRVVATLDTDDEPSDVVFAGSPERAFVSCSQENSVLVFDPNDLTVAPQRLTLQGEDPRAMAVSADGSEVYVAIFESGNGTTILGGGSTIGGGDPPNVVGDPAGPYGGQNPPPNSGGSFVPAQKPGNPAPPAVGLIVREDAAGNWMDDNGGDWTALVSGAQAAKSGRPVGWDLVDNDVAIIDAATLTVTYAERLMNVCMALAVNPSNDEVTVVGTEATNEVRFEPNLTGTFVRVHLARVDPSGPVAVGVADLNDHLDYTTGTVSQTERDESIGDPRGIVWNGSGTRAYVTGMGSNNVVVVDAAGARAGVQPTIEVGEGPTGVAIDEARSQLYVLDKFESAISVVDLALEVEVARVAFFDPSPAAIKVGRKWLYGTHETSGLGQTSCAACHVDARMDRLAWDLGDPAGDVKAFSGNCPDGGCQDWHPMKGPMTTQTLQDIIGHEPLHWRGDRLGIEEFNPAFVGLLGDDQQLTPAEMQEFEDFLATIAYPPNPYRNLDNTLPTSLPLPGHFTSGRFGPAGLPLPNGNAVTGLNRYRTGQLDGVQCVTCHALPAGTGTNFDLLNFPATPIPPGPDGELHHGLVSVDGSTNVSIKVPQLRNQYDKVGFERTQLQSLAGFGFLHDGSVDSIARFINEPLFSLSSDQDTANMVAFMLAFAGSDLPQGSPFNPLEPPGTPSQDTHAAVGRQTTVVGFDLNQIALLGQLKALADAGDVGLVVKGVQAGERRGWTYVGGDLLQSDRAAETATYNALSAAGAPGSELTWTAVPAGTETRAGIDRDRDGFFDRDELDAGSDPADPNSIPCVLAAPAAPTGLGATAVGPFRVDLAWTDAGAEEDGFRVERRRAGTGAWQVVGTTTPNVTAWIDRPVACETAFEYRVVAFNCGGDSAPSAVTAATTPTCPPTAPPRDPWSPFAPK